MAVGVAGLMLMITGDAGGAVRAIAETEAGLDTLRGAADTTSKGLNVIGTVATVLAVVGGTMAAVGAVSIKMAGDFQQQMEMISTQAHAAGYNIGELSQQVIALAPAVGQTPQALAQGLYHIASAGVPAAQAMADLKGAAQLATIGNANLEASAQAVIGVMAAYPNIMGGASTAAATLNAIVGSGDLKMNQLNLAIATGILPTAATFGLTLKDVGAALATMTDNVTPANVAATRLRMAITMMGAPSAAAQKALGGIGINATTLANDMRQPNGLLVALEDLKTHLSTIDPSQLQGGLATAEKDLAGMGFTAQQVNQMVGQLGPTATEQAIILARAFGGGRSAAGIMTLITELTRVQAKYTQIDDGIGKFGADWQTTTDNLNFQTSAFRSGLDGVAIIIGDTLLPFLTQTLTQVNASWPAFDKMAEVVASKLAPGVASVIPQLVSFIGVLIRIAPAAAALGVQILQLDGQLLGIAGRGLAALQGPLQWAADHFGTVKVVVGALVGLQLAGWLVNVAEGMKGLTAIEGVVKLLGLMNLQVLAVIPRLIAMAVAAAGDTVAFIALASSEGLVDALSLLNPVGLVIAGIVLLIGIIAVLVSHWSQVSAVMSATWGLLKMFGGWLKGEFAAALSWVGTEMGKLGELIGNVFSGLGTKVHDALAAIGAWLQANWLTILLTVLLGPMGFLLAQLIDHWNQIKTAFANGAQAAGRAVLTALQNLPYEVGALAGKLVSFVINEFLAWLRFTFVTMPQIIMAVLSWFGQLPFRLEALLLLATAKLLAWGVQLLTWATTVPPQWISDLFTWWNQLPGNLQALFDQGWASLIAWGEQLLNWVQTVPSQWISDLFTWWNQLPGRLASLFGQAWSLLVVWGGQALNWATTTGQNLLTNFVSGLEGLGGRLASLASGAIQSLVHAVLSAGSAVYSAASQIASQLVKGFMDNLKIGSPSRIMRELIGQNVIAGLTQGMDDKAATVTTSAKQITASLVNAFGGGQLGTSIAASVTGSGSGGSANESSSPTDRLLAQMLSELQSIRRGSQSPAGMAASLRKA